MTALTRSSPEYLRGIDGPEAADEIAATEALLAMYREALDDLLELCELHGMHDDKTYQASKRILSTTTPQAALNNAIAEELDALAENYCSHVDVRNRAKELRG